MELGRGEFLKSLFDGWIFKKFKKGFCIFYFTSNKLNFKIVVYQ